MLDNKTRYPLIECLKEFADSNYNISVAKGKWIVSKGKSNVYWVLCYNNIIIASYIDKKLEVFDTEFKGKSRRQIRDIIKSVLNI